MFLLPHRERGKKRLHLIEAMHKNSAGSSNTPMLLLISQKIGFASAEKKALKYKTLEYNNHFFECFFPAVQRRDRKDNFLRSGFFCPGFPRVDAERAPETMGVF